MRWTYKDMSKSTKTQEIQGRLEFFNISPKGSYEGLILRTKAGVTQVNFPREFAETVSAALKPGDNVTVEVTEFDDERDRNHPVYELVGLRARGGKQIQLYGGSFQGKVQRLNYARHGEPNGAILDSGDFIHLKPHGAKLLNLAVGQTLEGEGERKPLASGTGSVIKLGW
jgi:hypothetical protein